MEVENKKKPAGQDVDEGSPRRMQVPSFSYVFIVACSFEGKMKDEACTDKNPCPVVSPEELIRPNPSSPASTELFIFATYSSARPTSPPLS